LIQEQNKNNEAENLRKIKNNQLQLEILILTKRVYVGIVGLIIELNCKSVKLILVCVFRFSAVCEMLPAPENADLDCTDGNSFGSVCEILCNLGYTRVGVETFSCIETSQGTQWSHNIPFCIPSGKFYSFPLFQRHFCVCSFLIK